MCFVYVSIFIIIYSNIYSNIDIETNRLFGLRNELVHHLLTPHFFGLVCGMEWVDPSSPHSL
jgi:hypothetical protein